MIRAAAGNNDTTQAWTEGKIPAVLSCVFIDEPAFGYDIIKIRIHV